MLTLILMIPEQVMALGFVQLVGRMKRVESVLSLMKPAVAVQAIFAFVPLSHSLKQKRLL